MNRLYTILLILWVSWLLTGTVFYSYTLDLGWGAGFYMAVNVGYSIGWGDISEKDHPNSQIFSVFFVLCGSSFVGAALGIFANNIANENSNWYEHEMNSMVYEDLMGRTGHYRSKIKAFINFHWAKLRSIILFLLFITIAILSTLQNEDFSFVNSLYFAISSLSTGGLYAVPEQPDWAYGLIGLYAAFGIPVMALAMGTLAGFFIESNTIEETLQQIREPVDETEVQMLTDFELANNDGEIDKSEFIILCMIRTGAASPHLIKLINEYFDELDSDGSGSLSLAEICKQQAETRHKSINEAILRHAYRFSALGECTSTVVARDAASGVDTAVSSAATADDIELTQHAEMGGKEDPVGDVIGVEFF